MSAYHLPPGLPHTQTLEKVSFMTPVARISEPRSKRRSPAFVLLLTVAGAAMLATSGCAAWRIGQSAQLVRESEPLQHTPADATGSLLIVGDSTAVGTGASSARNSLAGWVAREYPRVRIENRARDGAKFADVATQLEAGGRFDVVLVQAGGNDVIRMRALSSLHQDVDRVADLARQRADRVLLMPAGNVGNAPFFFPPLSWLMTQRARELHRFVAAAAARTGAVYVNLFHERADDPFVVHPELNGRDGLHPSDAGYAVWWGELLEQSSLASWLTRGQSAPKP
jgi:lysophospholipase L1-like esterase